MCGIAGMAGSRIDPALVALMQQALLHRGPDDAGIWEDDDCCLAHRRLSIIDLSDAGRQPMISASGRYVVTFNGEIYNYRELRTQLAGSYVFQTQTDTEVLLAAWQQWGSECLHRLNGMFAFAVWDISERRLWLVRDRFGVKPLYYTIQKDGLLFASEPNALFAAGIEKIPDEAVWAGYLAHGSYGRPEQSFWKDICQVPAGHLAEWSGKGLRIEAWYRFAERVDQLQHHSAESGEAEEYLDSLFTDAVKLRFRSDVPVGFNLSGGLDSSLLLSMVSALHPDDGGIRAFSFYTGDERYDELLWVERLLTDKPYPLRACRLEAADVPDLAVAMSAVQGEPFGGIPTLAYGRIFQQARHEGILVLLDAQGGDEAWAGYDYYLNGSGSLVQGTITPPVRAEVLDGGFRAEAEGVTYPRPFSDALRNMQYRDLYYTKLPRALRFNDRVSMAYSIELREPFLDYRLVEFGVSRPAEEKIHGNTTKWRLRNLAERHMSSKLALAPKRPLQTPQREWLAGPLRDWVSEQVSWLAGHPWFEKSAICSAWDDYLRGGQDNSFFVWQWVNTALLLRNT